MNSPLTSRFAKTLDKKILKDDIGVNLEKIIAKSHKNVNKKILDSLG
jgi:hypothetical protein